MPDVAFLVMDIETVADGRLVQRVRYPDEPGLEPAAAVARYRKELLERSDGRSDFVPHTFQVPVAVAVVKVGADHRLVDARTLDRPRFRPQVIARQFWRGWEQYDRPTLVTFNGRFFDLPVLELAAYRYGIPVASWFGPTHNQYQHPRNRFNQQAHLDLQDFLGNQGAVHCHGGLNLFAKLLGLPGKMDTKGDMVQELWDTGQRERIDDYCLCDALDTYVVFLRTRVLAGLLPAEDEAAILAETRAWVERQAEARLALQEWLRRWKDWQPVTDDAEPFLG